VSFSALMPVASPSPSPTPTVVPSATARATASPSASPTPSAEPSGTPTASATPVPATPAPPPAQQTYVVQEGDTLALIAQQFGTTVEALQAANGIEDPNEIVIGDVLVIP
jgi:LysM repeat protein